MKIYKPNEKIEYPNPSIALGNFDGLHLGHIKVIENAKTSGDSFGALLFNTHSDSTVKEITTFEEKLEILEKIGVDFVAMVEFDENFKSKTCREFCMYLDELGVKAVSVGYDYRCGKGASADCFELKKELFELGIKTVILPPVEKDAEIVKSTMIRKLILNGDIKNANRLLFREFSLSGKVIKGKQNGRLLGFPTANIEIAKNKLLPADGVYLGECTLSKKYRVILSIGKNPTFNASVRTVEAHIIDYDDDLYGENISIKLFDRIRDCKRFLSLDELSKQLKMDREYAIGFKERI